MSSDAFERDRLAASPVEDWSGRIEAMLMEVEATSPGAARSALLCRLAEIYERKLGDPGAALVTLRTALSGDPRSGRVIQEMERLARGHGLWAELASATAEVAGVLADRKQAADLWVQIGFWNESGRAQLDEAVAAAETALVLEPTHGGALALLESLHRRQRSWDRYVEVLDRRRALPGADPSRLADSYREVLRYEPRHAAALDGLAGLQEDAGAWNAAADLLRRLLVALPAGPARQVAQHRLARLLKERLDDPRAAEELLALALAEQTNAAHAPSLLLLAAIYRERKDWLKARQLLGRAAAAVGDVGEKVRILDEAAEICAGPLDDEVQAADLYTEILALDDTRADLIEKLAEIKLRRGDFSGLLPLAELLAARAEGEPPPERARRLHRLGRAREATGDEEGAIEAYRDAAVAEVPSTSPSVATIAARRDLADLAFRREDWSEAAAAYTSALVDPDALPRGALGAAYERLGIARLRAGAPDAALAPLEKALALDPHRVRALETLVEAARAAGDDEAVVRHAHALLAVTGDPKTKLGLLEQVAIIHRDRRHDPQRAIAAYLEALKLWPSERSIMHRLLELYTETKQWRQAVQLLGRLAELTAAPTRAAYHIAAANILADELAARGEAIEAFELALDLDPHDLASFQRIDALVTEAHDWRAQERIYRRQIKRLSAEAPPGQRPALILLWDGLGEIYRTRLQDAPAAIAAFEIAEGLDPASTARRRALAELYRLAGPDGYAKAIAEHRALVARAPTADEAAADLRMLVRLFVELGALEEAHGAAAALVLLGCADADERALFEQYRPDGLVKAQARLTEEDWQHLVAHPEEDRALSQLVAALVPAAAEARARPLKEAGLKKRQRREVAADPSPVCQAIVYAAGVLGRPLPEVYVVPERDRDIDVVDLRIATAATPALVLGGTVMAPPRSETELAFVAGRVLAALRPEQLARWPSFVATPAELTALVHAALRLFDPHVEPDPAAVDAPQTELLRRALSPAALEQVKALVRRFHAAGNLPDLERWSRAASLSTLRAGLLLAGDLEVAARVGPAACPTLAADEITRELIAWSVSDSYATLRTQLGLRAVNLDFRG